MRAKSQQRLNIYFRLFTQSEEAEQKNNEIGIFRDSITRTDEADEPDGGGVVASTLADCCCSPSSIKTGPFAQSEFDNNKQTERW